ncbi:ribonuclease BN (tRNA processing enzyme) [Bacillus oleivorans]|uniref:Ribonuclease BN (tRNA processing enzyme) n=1 Tax=Bacillus oleivorans TaxID=1448271 RepID=A0A285D5Y6_9BACI|nr:MBL fold metallo-hydrolase [Bacillus oleivorans]SNX74688.1 ribonuclease BN (tRNA processing enzyme) [Bacillus oleivorans]
MKLTTVGYWGAYAEKNEATSCYLVEEEDTKILIDCGSGALSKLQNYIELTELDAVFISHIHTDHIADIYSLEFAMLIQTQLKNRKKPLDVYIYAENLETLSFAYPDIVHVKKINLEDSIQIGPFTLSFMENIHEIPCCSIKVSNQQGTVMVYSADTGYNERFIDFCKEVNLLLIECSFFKAQKGFVKGHLSSGEVGEIISKANVEEAVLTHFPHFGQVDQLVEEVKAFCDKKIYRAKEGFSIKI